MRSLILKDVAVIGCPRCGRWGVIRRHPSEEDRLIVQWADPAIGHWADDFGPGDLDPEVGCGYDDKPAQIAWDGVRRATAMLSGFDPVVSGTLIAERKMSEIP